ncbi:hypothetical protein ACFVZ3_14405 [Kitasatospora purpeofusca]|uniref:hypothetical protein n=1 Tax=Kitasatospora purpeofusca TaxID=67352 RepID=UPI0036AD356B
MRADGRAAGTPGLPGSSTCRDGRDGRDGRPAVAFNTNADWFTGERKLAEAEFCG